MNEKKVSIVADVASAYEPEVGVKKFFWRFDFTAPLGFVVSDDLKTTRPQTITAYLQADNKIKNHSSGVFNFESGGRSSLLASIMNPNLFTC